MVMEYVLLFYIFGVGLVAYIFNKMDKRYKEISRTKVERIEEQWEHDKLYAPTPKNI
jgi:hypothetical protein